MTAANSYSKKKFNVKLLKNEILSHWWLMMFYGILYMIAGPLVLWMTLANVSKSNYSGINGWTVTQELTDTIAAWFCGGGFISYYVMAMLMGAILPVILFGYLNSKKQTNFYHSLPISRSHLFINHTLSGIAITFIPMLIAVVLMVLIALIYGQWSDIRFGFILFHIAYIFLYFMLSYSLALLATQLTGTALTQIAMTGVLHFGVVALLGCTFIAKSIFYATYVEDMDYLIYWSPISNFAMFANDWEISKYWNFTHLPLEQIVAIAAITLLAVVLAWIGYKKRPSESATRPIVYFVVQPILKFAIMYCAVCLCGILFMEIGGPLFFFVGFVIAAILVQIFAEIIFNKDFTAMLKNKGSFAIMAAVLLIFYGGMYFDVTKYDAYVPENEKIAYIETDLFGWDSSSYYFREEDYGAIDENFITRFDTEEDIALFAGWLRQVVDDGNYRRNSYRYSNNFLDGVIKTTSIEVKYVLESGREVKRHYRSIPTLEYKDELGAIYETDGYKNSLKVLLERFEYNKLGYYEVVQADSGYAQDDVFAYYANEKTIEKDPYREDLYQAMVKDLLIRDSATLEEIPLYRVNMEFFDKARENRYTTGFGRFAFHIYEQDENMLKVIEKIMADTQMSTVDYRDMADKIEKLEVYSVDETTNAYDLAYDNFDNEKNRENYQAVLHYTITDKAEIEKILQETVMVQEFVNAPFMDIDTSVVIKGKITHISEERSYDEVIEYNEGHIVEDIKAEAWVQKVQTQDIALFYKMGECPYQFE